jgi:hypothetical protein
MKADFSPDLIGQLLPEHDRTSCNDDNSNGNEFFNEFGAPRCRRCAVLHFVRNGEWPNGAVANVDVALTLVVPKSMTYQFTRS